MKYIFLFFFILCTTHLFAQESKEQSVMQVVNRVFEAMRTNDSTMLKSCFTENATTYTLFRDQEGVAQLREGSLQKFAEAVGKPKTDVWNEPIWNEKVNIDGPLATVWVDYAFYLNDQFLHCGVDAFQLVDTQQGWKIFHLADTRRKSDCEVPKEVKNSFE